MEKYKTSFFEMHKSKRALDNFAMTSADKAAAVTTLGLLMEKIGLAIEEAKQISEIWSDVTVQVNICTPVTYSASNFVILVSIISWGKLTAYFRYLLFLVSNSDWWNNVRMF